MTGHTKQGTKEEVRHDRKKKLDMTGSGEQETNVLQVGFPTQRDTAEVKFPFPVSRAIRLDRASFILPCLSPPAASIALRRSQSSMTLQPLLVGSPRRSGLPPNALVCASVWLMWPTPNLLSRKISRRSLPPSIKDSVI